LTSPQGDVIEFLATLSPTGKEIVNSMKGKVLEDIKVVNEYPDRGSVQSDDRSKSFL
jgi:hypothetical protein